MRNERWDAIGKARLMMPGAPERPERRGGAADTAGCGRPRRAYDGAPFTLLDRPKLAAGVAARECGGDLVLVDPVVGSGNDSTGVEIGRRNWWRQTSSHKGRSAHSRTFNQLMTACLDAGSIALPG